LGAHLFACMRVVFVGVAALIASSLLHSEFLGLSARPVADIQAADEPAQPLRVVALRHSFVK